jgi:hypothetical protein
MKLEKTVNANTGLKKKKEERENGRGPKEILQKKKKKRRCISYFPFFLWFLFEIIGVWMVHTSCDAQNTYRKRNK